VSAKTPIVIILFVIVVVALLPRVLVGFLQPQVVLHPGVTKAIAKWKPLIDNDNNPKFNAFRTKESLYQTRFAPDISTLIDDFKYPRDEFHQHGRVVASYYLKMEKLLQQHQQQLSGLVTESENYQCIKDIVESKQFCDSSSKALTDYYFINALNSLTTPGNPERFLSVIKQFSQAYQLMVRSPFALIRMLVAEGTVRRTHLLVGYYLWKYPQAEQRQQALELLGEISLPNDRNYLSAMFEPEAAANYMATLSTAKTNKELEDTFFQALQLLGVLDYFINYTAMVNHQFIYWQHITKQISFDVRISKGEE
jgi:hypothetical protein